MGVDWNTARGSTLIFFPFNTRFSTRPWKRPGGFAVKTLATPKKKAHPSFWCVNRRNRFFMFSFFCLQCFSKIFFKGMTSLSLRDKNPLLSEEKWEFFGCCFYYTVSFAAYLLKEFFWKNLLRKYLNNGKWLF